MLSNTKLNLVLADLAAAAEQALQRDPPGGVQVVLLKSNLILALLSALLSITPYVLLRSVLLLIT